MAKLSILLTKDSIGWATGKGSSYLEKHYTATEDHPLELILDKLDEAFETPKIKKVEVISAINHFTLLPLGFDQHELAYPLLSFNAKVDENLEEAMLAKNRSFHVQFYYALPKRIYQKIKSKKLPTLFNFSGEKLLENLVLRKSKPQFHIHLYEKQCEFFAFKNSKIVLYNNLDEGAEVDFLYFVMFSVKKLGFSLGETLFYIYGNVEANETFLQELHKFSPHVNIVGENLKNKFNFILQ